MFVEHSYSNSNSGVSALLALPGFPNGREPAKRKSGKKIV
jgi:hypothetical protein